MTRINGSRARVLDGFVVWEITSRLHARLIRGGGVPQVRFPRAKFAQLTYVTSPHGVDA